MNAPDAVKTRTAHWGWDEHRYFGKAVFAELTGKESLASLVALSVVGRSLPPECIGLIDDVAGAVTLADPRIWPLKLTRLIASYGSTLPAVAAGLLMQEEARIGPWACVHAAHTLLDLCAALGDEVDDQLRVAEAVRELLGRCDFVWGFGTPFRRQDERLVALREHVVRRGRDGLPYYRLMNRTADLVREARGAEPNLGIALAAIFLDMGLVPQEIGALVACLMQHMFFAQAVEGARQADPGLRQLSPESLDYVGRPSRTSPRAERERSAGATDVGACRSRESALICA
jgi:hypothetical protein